MQFLSSLQHVLSQPRIPDQSHPFRVVVLPREHVRSVAIFWIHCSHSSHCNQYMSDQEWSKADKRHRLLKPSIKEGSKNDTWNAQFGKVLNYNIKIKVLGRYLPVRKQVII